MMSRGLNKHKENSYAAILFLLWPFLAVISAIANYKKPWSKNVMWAFFAFYGLTYAIGAESQSSDIVRYVESYQLLNGKEMSLEKATEYFDQSGNIDILSTAISIGLSRFTDSQAALTLVYGIIFGFFFSRNIWFVMSRLEGKLKPVTVILLFCFFTVIPIWFLGGFRFWTATHIFTYGVLLFAGDGNRKGLLIACSSFLVHYTFLMPIAVLLFYYFAGNWLTAYFIFYLSTFFLTELDLEAFNNLFEAYLPEIMQERSSSYRSEIKVEEFREADLGEVNWYAIWYRKALSWSIMGFMAVLYFFSREAIKENKNWLNLYSFTLLLLGAANLLTSIPSGGRYLSVASLIALAFLTWYVQNKPHEIVLKRFNYFAMPALTLYIVVTVRTSLINTSVATILGNPFTALLFGSEHMSLNDLMRMIL